MGDPRAACSADPLGLMCKHSKTKYGHCNTVTCSNYWNDCPRHSGEGSGGN